MPFPRAPIPSLAYAAMMHQQVLQLVVCQQRYLTPASCHGQVSGCQEITLALSHEMSYPPRYIMTYNLP